MTPETRYAKTGDLHIAYQVVGDGPVDIVFVPEFWHTIEVQWDQPELAAFLERLASFGRLISFDQRGSGVSDPVSLDELPSIEQWMDDVRVVMGLACQGRRLALITHQPFQVPDQVHGIGAAHCRTRPRT